jgi:hypothetical protein
VYLNWALGLRSLGFQVVWLEHVSADSSIEEIVTRTSTLKAYLYPFGLSDSVALCSWSERPLSSEVLAGCLDLETAAESDLLINMQYGTSPDVVGRFHRSVMVDIDPGLLQTWMTQGIRLAPHDIYLTISETIASPQTRFQDSDVMWQYTPPCVALDWWPEQTASKDAPFTTISHWYSGEWLDDAGESYQNDKRSAFLPYIDLPAFIDQRLELALCLTAEEEDDLHLLRRQGWTVRHAYDISETPRDYQQYVQQSSGEFSCAKPSYVRMQTAWISDRTVCYLASGKPAVVQHTGPSRFLPDAAGLFRFHDLSEAKRYLNLVANDYDHQCKLARELAEQHFDARQVVGSVLERSLA